jgi:carotenoid cleavage dioxygenase-like enzyme
MSLTIQDDPAARKLTGSYYAPVAGEVEGFDLPVKGAIPPGLAGRFVRNGPNPRGARNGHPFMAEGMLHGIRLEDGAARWYRNRWVRTRSFETGAPYVRADGTLDFTAGPANTNAIAHGGKLFALVESSFPTEITRELDTLGAFDFGGALKTPFTAHPKRCPRTGELHAFGMSMRPPGLTYHRIDAAGTLVESRPIPVRGMTMMHDFALTDRHVIFMDLPMVFDLARASAGEMPFAWSDTYGARLGVLRRDDPAAEVRWFEIEPCYVFHVLNAYDDAGSIVVDVVRYPELWRKDARTFEPAALHRWTIDLTAARVRETPLDDTAIEFPRADERRLGSAYRFGYAAEMRDDERASIRKYDLATATSTKHDFGAGRFTGEPVFVPAADDAGEDAGWLMAFVYDAARDASDFVILDASDLRTPPVATIALPQRVPAGFHGNWIDDANLR